MILLNINQHIFILLNYKKWIFVSLIYKTFLNNVSTFDDDCIVKQVDNNYALFYRWLILY